METREGLVFLICSRVFSLNSSTKKSVVKGGAGDPIGHPISVLTELSTKGLVCTGDGVFKQDQDVFFNVSKVEVQGPLPHTHPNQKRAEKQIKTHTHTHTHIYIYMESL